MWSGKKRWCNERREERGKEQWRCSDLLGRKCMLCFICTAQREKEQKMHIVHPPLLSLLSKSQREKNDWLSAMLDCLVVFWEDPMVLCFSVHTLIEVAHVHLCNAKTTQQSLRLPFISYYVFFFPSGHKWVFFYISCCHSFSFSSSSDPLPGHPFPPLLIVLHWYYFCLPGLMTTCVHFPQAKASRCPFL